MWYITFVIDSPVKAVVFLTHPMNYPLTTGGELTKWTEQPDVGENIVTKSMWISVLVNKR